MDRAQVQPVAPPPRRRNDKGRRSWSAREEQLLLSGLKEIIANGWKSENGFRVGYLQALEAYICKEFPGTDLKATPHINSRIHTWKKNYGSLFSMLSKSGIGWNPTTKMIEATDEAWESYLKVDINAKLMRYKSWPFYEDWCEIFGKDRAQGLEAEGFVEAVNTVLQEPDTDGSNIMPGLGISLNDEDASTTNMSFTQPATSGTTKKSAGRKRKLASGSDTLCEILGSFADRTDARLAEISKRMGHDYDMACARKDVWAVVDKFDELSLRDKMLATKQVISSHDDMVLWFTLPVHAREDMVRMKLAGHM